MDNIVPLWIALNGPIRGKLHPDLMWDSRTHLQPSAAKTSSNTFHAVQNRAIALLHEDLACEAAI